MTGARRGKRWLPALAAGLAALAVACSSDAGGSAAPAGATPGESATASPTLGVASPTPEVEAAVVDFSDYDRPLSAAEASFGASLSGSFPELDYRLRSIDLTELIRGGPPRDGIPALVPADLVFIDAAEGDAFLDDGEPVIALEIAGEARAYPIRILMWHEIANDVVGGVPVAVTFCPLCNTAITFDRRVAGEVREFGVSGLLRRSDLVMYDRTQESFWQQITGEAIVGTDTGTRLTFIASQMVSWGDFKQTFPEAPVLSTSTGYVRRYGENPYGGYDRLGSGFFFNVEEYDDERLDAKERVLTVQIEGDAVAFPFSELSEHVTLVADVAGRPVVAFWQPDTFSPLDEAFIVGSRNVGAAAAYSPIVDGEVLTFEARDGEIVDAQTGSVWNVLGRAVSGPMAGQALEPVVSANHFWFAWVVFEPETRIVRAGPG